MSTPRGVALALGLLAAACGPAADARPSAAGVAATDAGLAGLAAFVACEVDAPVSPRGGCVRAAYLWSSSMPLSEDGRAEAVAAAGALGAAVRPVEATLVESWLAAGGGAAAVDALALDLIGSGATLHYPSLVLFRDGERLGPAILGYKTAEAYRSLWTERLDGGGEEPVVTVAAAAGPEVAAAARLPARAQQITDHVVPGRTGAYFRWVPGTRSIAYEAGGEVFLLDLDSGERARAPGVIDFVPTPDGRLFVTPGRARTGLDFYDAREVLAASARHEGAAVRPVFTDERMRDQYPSAGILRSDASGRVVTYRILTSWFAAVVHRDYEVTWGEGGRPRVRPLGEPVPACRERGVSLPIMAPDGLELAGRDERTGTTKLFRLGGDGLGCAEVVDLGVPTTKVAFDPAAGRLAFAVPATALRDGVGRPYRGLDAEGAYGVFVYDRASRSMERLSGSEEALRLTIPEFFGDEGVVFLLAGGARGTSRFRLVPLDAPAG